MANTIQHKRSTTASSVPSAGQLAVGELALNLTDKKIYSKDGSGNVVDMSGGFGSGTVMLFVQTAAPTGWTKSTSHDNKALRVVSGTAGSGGSAAFTTAFGTPSVSGSLSGTVGATTLTIDQMPSHSHFMLGSFGGSQSRPSPNLSYMYPQDKHPTSSTGGNGSHTHSFSGSLSSATVVMNVAYVDAIIATKD